MAVSRIGLIVLLFAVVRIAGAVQAPDTVTLQLKWKHQFQFAGYYAALHKGFYQDAGLRVSIVEGGQERSVSETVASGQAEFGVGNSQLILDRASGLPVVVLAPIIQHSPLSLVVRHGSGIRDVADLAGKRVMYGPNDAELLAYFIQSGLHPADYQRQTHSQNIDDLIEGRTDAISAYSPDQPYTLHQAGIGYTELRAIDAGIDFYGDTLFTSEAQVKRYPQRVRAFRAASLKGWAYALQHPDEIAELIQREYIPERPLEHLKWEARQYRRFIMADLIELGHNSESRWQHIADIYTRLGMLPERFDFSGMIYHPDGQDLSWLYPWLAGTLTILILLGGFAYLQMRSRRAIFRVLSRQEKMTANLPGMIYQFLLRADGRSCFPYASAGIYGVYGVDPAAVRVDAAPMFEVLHPDDLERVRRSIALSAESLNVWRDEYRVIHPEHGEIWLEGHATPTRLENGDVLWHGFITDISERKAMEQALRKSEARFRNIAATVPGMLCDYVLPPRPDAGFLYVGPRCRDILELEPEAVLGDARAFTRLIHPDDLPRLAVEEQNASREGRYFNAEFRIIALSGRLKWLQLTAQPNPAANGESVVWTGIMLDVTERKQAEEKLAQAKEVAESANRAKSVFLSSMSHELRTPLNSVIGFSQLLESDTDEPLTEGQLGSVRMILGSGRHLLKLVNEILDLVRIESGKTELKLVPVALLPVFKEVILLLSTMASARGIELRLCRRDDTAAESQPAAQSPALAVKADLDKLRQLLLNLVSNAVKYNRDGGTVDLDYRIQGKTVTIDVTDTGIGIPERYQSELFKPFQRLGAERSSIEGTGIGLVICKQLAEVMGGRIGCESREGVGSHFWVELAVAEPEPEYISEAVDAEDAGVNAVVGEGVCGKVVYVEDNSVNVDVMRQVFRRLPELQLDVAASAEQALPMIRALQPDLVLMDINLPGMSGEAALRDLRRDPATAAVPVIAISADAMSEDVARYMAAGFQAYVTKPFNIAELIGLIRRCIAGQT
ncbi:ABC transporter substrate-binding protein [Methylomonas sp. EFPC3]|uniref:ABC transporter substrate-binding protein n=1 Tax=Methylomonas sp. EFPC3 TaxID=3021710 RepID=UPI0024176219|nr:ABC transporter substrate-binding protein [Methylomonas sp. EFPC3]WFP49986.1 ABC transporter substrate-binding protein [Methylomonas sp. EFPC3]